MGTSSPTQTVRNLALSGFSYSDRDAGGAKNEPVSSASTIGTGLGEETSAAASTLAILLRHGPSAVGRLVGKPIAKPAP